MSACDLCLRRSRLVALLAPRITGLLGRGRRAQGLLALRDDPAHTAAADEHEIEFVDLVCVNLYPF